MPNPTWPASLPQDFFIGLSERRRPAFQEFAVDAGPSMRRRIFGGSKDDLGDPIVLDQAQRVTFDTFYRTTLEEGTLEFDWTHPVSGATATYRFADAPSFTHFVNTSGFFYQGQLSLELMP